MCVAPSYSSKCGADRFAFQPRRTLLPGGSLNEIASAHAGAREPPPHFTFALLTSFVNPIRSVSTGFFRFLLVFIESDVNFRYFRGFKYHKHVLDPCPSVFLRRR
jgi:hypothetical protein